MPIDYSTYPKDWKTKIRPDILRRAKNQCEFCLVKNRTAAFRGVIEGQEVYQTISGQVFNADTGKRLADEYQSHHVYIEPKSGNPNQQAISIVLTIMHLDHDITNNCYSNLAAGCQRCHNKYDAKNRAINRKAKRNAAQVELF